MALAGGVSLNLLQNGGYRYQAGAILAGRALPRLRCPGRRHAGAAARIVVLKRLDDALRDGDTIHAVILASAANNDGADKVASRRPASTARPPWCARRRPWRACRPTPSAGGSPWHGHAAGDPIEIAALTQAFGASTQRRGYCAIGSVKTNIGHLDAAAGVTGLIKAQLSLRHATFAAQPAFRAAAPADRLLSAVPSMSTPWPGPGPRRPRRAARA
jgi:acyl transferase domain-containing protein